MKNQNIKFCQALIGIIIAYFAISFIIFSFRHPWMPEKEALFNLGKVLRFEKISYKENHQKHLAE